MPGPLVITNCTGRKRSTGGCITLDLPNKSLSLSQVAHVWKQAVGDSQDLAMARDLYVGRTVSDALKVSRTLNGELFFISAGLGLVHEKDLIPEYDLTFADSDNPLARILKDREMSPCDWWHCLLKEQLGRGKIADLVAMRSPPQLLIALPSGYLKMICQDLVGLPREFLQQTRIFTSPAGKLALDHELQECALPYDDRLESIEGFSGTRTDFPQRAMLHFVSRLNGIELDLEGARKAVSISLSNLQPRVTPNRSRLQDSEIAAMLRTHWKDFGGNSSRLLRFLRNEANIACEQGRFRAIWHSVRQDLTAKDLAR